MSTADSGLQWFCRNCRNQSHKNFQPSLDAVGSDLDDLTSKCEILFNNLFKMKSSLSSFNFTDKPHSRNNNSSWDCSHPQLSVSLPINQSDSRGYRSWSPSFIPVATRRKKKTVVSPITISSAPDPSIHDSLIVFSPLPGLDSHFFQAPPDRSSPKTSYAGVLSSAAKATTAATVGDRSSVPYPKSCPLKAVPSPKILFVSRLTPK